MSSSSNATKPLTKKAQAAQGREQARIALLAMLKPGDTVYCIMRHVSRSGMQRHISLKIANGPDNVQDITHTASRAMGERLIVNCNRHSHNAIVARGCGMDMGAHLVYGLGAVLWPTGTPKPHGTRNGQPDSDGGFALKHRWL